MNKPVEHEYTSHVAYTRALEEYCVAQAAVIEKLTKQRDELLKALKEIKSGHCPYPYPESERGLIDYHYAVAEAASASIKKGSER